MPSDSSTDLPPLPDYDNPPIPFWVRHGGWLAPVAVFVATVVLTVVSFPPYSLAEFGYAFAAPALLWAYRGVPLRRFAGVVLGAQALAWTLILGWLHHVTWAGLVLLGPLVGIWVGSWFLLAWWAVPRMVQLPTLTRLAAMLGLAGAWVVIEWTRTWLLSGFPWLPLAASQWERNSILQIAAFTGAGGVSFVLMAMNIGFAAYAHRLLFERAKGLRRRSQEFLLAMFLLVVCLTVHVQESANRAQFTQPVGRIGFVQPYVPQAVKWDRAQGPITRATLEQGTLEASRRQADLILWPEAVTPWAVQADPDVNAWTEALVAQARVPVVLGSIAIEPPEPPATDDERWLNGAFVVQPDTGLAANYYAKRHLVPFGEYVPLRPLLGWIGKFVEIGGDFEAGDSAQLLRVQLNGSDLRLGPLICYEDIYANLARESVAAGADILVVLTNNAWFGEGGAAYQHAAHSVLRAVETRRPVLRIGNGGWSGWIDEFGNIRAELRKVTRPGVNNGQPVITSQPFDRKERDAGRGTIYFRGAGIADVSRDLRWVDRESFYVQHGDWFVFASLALAGFGFLAIKTGRPVIQPDE